MFLQGQNTQHFEPRRGGCLLPWNFAVIKFYTSLLKSSFRTKTWIFLNRLTTSPISKTPLQSKNIPMMRHNQHPHWPFDTQSNWHFHTLSNLKSILIYEELGKFATVNCQIWQTGLQNLEKFTANNYTREPDFARPANMPQFKESRTWCHKYTWTIWPNKVNHSLLFVLNKNSTTLTTRHWQQMPLLSFLHARAS